MPCQAGSIALCQSHMAAAPIASNTALMPGQRVFLIHDQTASAAVLIPPHAHFQRRWNQSVLVAMSTMTAIRATIAITIHVIGLASRDATNPHSIPVAMAVTVFQAA